MIVIVSATFALIAFAANNLLCRMALGSHVIDPVSFTTIRLVSGALALIALSWVLGRSKTTSKTKGSWGSGFLLFVYAAAFSMAYVSLSTGIGALFLFGSVQMTMIVAAIKSGEKIGPMQWVGSTAAICGLFYLVLPGISAPNHLGAMLMCVSGIAWGVYSIRGKYVSASFAMTAGNFTRSAPMALIVSLIAFHRVHLDAFGILLALISGIVTSGLGYVLWYMTLHRLTITQASVLQLTVPVLSTLGGIAFLSEQLSARLIIASAMILGGMVLTLVKRKNNSEVL